MAKNPLFRSNIEPRCVYCQKSSHLDDRTAICRKCGVVDLSYRCNSFKYDPLKRIPPKKPVIRGSFSKEDFSILD